MGFWSTLATIGTALIPGGAAFAPLVGAGVGALTNYIGGSSSGTPSTAAGSSAGLIPSEAQPFLSQAQSNPAVKSAEGYYQKALGGDRGQLQQLLGPEINTVLTQYDTAAKTAATLSPRGGARADVLSELPFKKVEAYGNALNGARNGAADKLGALGSAEAGRDNSIAQGLIGAKTSANRLDYEKQKDKNSSLNGIGSSLGSIIVDLFGKKKAGGGSSSAPSYQDTLLSNPKTDWSALSNLGD